MHLQNPISNLSREIREGLAFEAALSLSTLDTASIYILLVTRKRPLMLSQLSHADKILPVFTRFLLCRTTIAETRLGGVS